MKLSTFRRIFEQDYPEDYKSLMSQLGIPLNSSFEEIYNALNKKLTFAENINSTIKEFTIAVDSSGVPRNNTQFKLEDTQTSVEGLSVIKVTGDVLPTAGVFVDFVKNNNYIVIRNIKGLQADIPYKIKVLCFS